VPSIYRTAPVMMYFLIIVSVWDGSLWHDAVQR
jgi:hypothetical protein